MKIGNKNIGDNYPTYIIAELSCNHNQDLNVALQLIHEAKKAGADAIKIQTYTPDTMTINCSNEYFQINNGTIWDGQTLYDLYKKAYTPWSWTITLKNEANRLGMELFSTPFDVTAVDFLEQLNMPAYKIASFEVCDHILLKRIAKTGKPIIMSSGVSDLTELEESIKILKNNGATNICLLKCTSAYPAPIEDANLKTIKDIKKRFNIISGLSDHTLGVEVPIAAVCLGANIIEKHFKLENDITSPDHKFSLNPTQFKQMVNSIRKIENAIGKIKYDKSEKEKRNYKFKRSLFIVKNVKKNQLITPDNIKSIRPNNGLHTRYYEQILGKKFNNDYKKGEPLTFDKII